MRNSEGDSASNTGKNCMDFSGDLFSVNTTDWGTIEASIRGDASAGDDNYLDGVVVDPENQYSQLYNSNELHSSMPNLEVNKHAMAASQISQGNGNSYLPYAYAKECDESDYGEILVDHDAIDAVSTVTPATFAQRETMVNLAQSRERNMPVVADDTSHEVAKVSFKNTRRRKLIIGGICLVAVVLLAIVVAIPIVVGKAHAGESAQISSAENGVIENDNNQSENEADDNTPGITENETDHEISGYYGINAPIENTTYYNDDKNQTGLTGTSSLSNNVLNPGEDSDSEDANHFSTEHPFQEDIDSNRPVSTAFGKTETLQESLSNDNQSISATDVDSNQDKGSETPYVTVVPPASSPTFNSPNLFVPETGGQPQPAIENLSDQFDSSSGTLNSARYEPSPVPSSTSTEAFGLSSMSTPANVAERPTCTSSSNTINPTYENVILPFSDDSQEVGSITSTPTYLSSYPQHPEDETSFNDTMVPTSSPQQPTLQPTKFTESVVKIKLQTDKQGYETSWSLESVGFDLARNTNTSTVIARVDTNTYSSYQKDSKTFTLPQGMYRFTLRDAFGDGFCCKEFQGYYSISIDGREIIKGGYYRSEISYDFLIGYFPEMTERETQWLEAHNVRRKTWHENNGVSYVPLRWSSQLAKQAEAWANKLTADCEIVGIEHEHGVEEGENLAKNQADGRKGMGRLFPPDNILRRWVDQEADLPNPHNLHLTQALWRATKYVGCGDAIREDDDGSVCRIQVCRYAKAGNCQMGKYNVTEGDNWLIPMLMDDSPCPPECPPEGCF